MLNLEKKYDSCIEDGCIKSINNVNAERIRSILSNADITISSAQMIIKSIGIKSKEWLNVYTSYYESLRMLSEALLCFDKVSVPNHQCLFACLCVKHPDLELDWNFFEKVRTKRNGVYYYGEQITYQDWKSAEIQFKLYISTLRKEIESKLGEYK